MGFHSSHGKINWSYHNYNIFLAELHRKLPDELIVDYNVFEAYAHSDEGCNPNLCHNLAIKLMNYSKENLSEDAQIRLNQIIDALNKAFNAKEPLRFI